MMDSVVNLGQGQEWLAPPDRSRIPGTADPGTGAAPASGGAQ
jgi:hypothetical protein